MGEAQGHQGANVIDGCEDSLHRLGVETIDLYWLHRDDDETRPDEYLGALDTLLKDGKVRAVGASNFGVARFEAALKESDTSAKSASSRNNPSTAY